jgi:hypothetical protein
MCRSDFFFSTYNFLFSYYSPYDHGSAAVIPKITYSIHITHVYKIITRLYIRFVYIYIYIYIYKIYQIFINVLTIYFPGGYTIPYKYIYIYNIWSKDLCCRKEETVKTFGIWALFFRGDREDVIATDTILSHYVQ